ncbi:MAG: hypothetical protein GX619_03735, partial [Bacteroidales bacterium]|nr:hypothetical protein [Bacteroidales bacterium]
MKRKGYIGLALVLIVVGSSVVVLNSASFQRRLVNQLSHTLTANSGSSLTIGSASLNVFRGVVLRDVFLKDSVGTPMLTAKRLEAGLRILPLLRKRIEFHALRLIRPEVWLQK